MIFDYLNIISTCSTYRNLDWLPYVTTHIFHFFNWFQRFRNPQLSHLVRTFQYQGGGYVWDSRLRDVKELVAADDAFAALRADGSVVTFGGASVDCRWDDEKRWKTMEHWETDMDNMETDDVGAFLNWKHENDEMLIIIL